MSCCNTNLPQPNNDCCADVIAAARLAYSSAEQAAASAANAATTLANAVEKTGDTMSGPLILSGDPAVALGAATKQYVDNAVSIGLTIPDGSITTPKLANLAVQTGKIADLAVTTQKIANNAVDGTKIPDLTITTNKIADSQVTYAKLGTVEKTRVAKAWVNFDGTTSPGTIRSQFNVSSVTKTGTGQYTVNFSTPMADADYTVAFTTNRVVALNIAIPSVTSTSTGSFNIICQDSSSPAFGDCTIGLVQVFGN